MSTEPTADTDDLPEQLRVRREKRARLLEQGVDPYPVGVARTHSLAEIRTGYGDLEPDQATGVQVGVTGRVIFLRNSGKLCFVTLREGGAGDEGVELQAMISLAGVGADALAAFKADVDLGDHLFVHGEVITSRRGELSVLADSWRLTAKALRPLPVAHRPLSEENRVRQRYVDLIVRPQARRTVEMRAAVNASVRSVLTGRGFLEVETPMLQLLHGGAAARPFVTHMNALDLDLYLRIAPELYLKRCVVGGIDRVFEVNRNFRNEGTDSTHSPEFAMLEAYQTYSDYDGMAELTRTLIQQAAITVFGSTTAVHADGSQYDLGGEWESITLFGALSEAVGEQIDITTPMSDLVALAERLDVPVAPHYGPGKLAEELFEATVVDRLQAPTFVRDFPAETSPLVRGHRTVPGLAEKWDLYLRGAETATGYSELVDPVVQRDRFLQQARFAGLGDAEAMVLDEDFLRAMEYGLPPMGGVGMGIDRLLMALTGLGIRETILFPFVRPAD
ncbi:lysine--tRNA ligase [Nakamurella endophytica]|uniref:Lysine--tRNA ligase n=1 Tax=Nakamurella endophytica TaxID=1748367 RepID=A0A917WHF1_9ACTN|nr:lysine--tRNA ligase [Nakamurella endophytica]GGM04225.1 lysine--tRNA ligase [Nakamurella endophytica]